MIGQKNYQRTREHTHLAAMPCLLHEQDVSAATDPAQGELFPQPHPAALRKHNRAMRKQAAMPIIKKMMTGSNMGCSLCTWFFVVYEDMFEDMFAGKQNTHPAMASSKTRDAPRKRTRLAPVGPHSWQISTKAPGVKPSAWSFARIAPSASIECTAARVPAGTFNKERERHSAIFFPCEAVHCRLVFLLAISIESDCQLQLPEWSRYNSVLWQL
jgi:hypothetical protein